MAEAQTPANVTAKPGSEPDPTVLTTQALWREIAHSNELENVKIASIQKAIDLAHQDAERFPTDIDKAVGNLEKLFNERFKSFDLALQGEHNLKEEKFNKVEQRFNLIETTRVEQKAEAAAALQTALAAAKDVINEQSKNTIAAAAKSELAFTKQIDQQSVLIQSIHKSLDDKINDIRERQMKTEGHAQGGKDLWLVIVAIVGVFGTILGIVAYFNKT